MRFRESKIEDGNSIIIKSFHSKKDKHVHRKQQENMKAILRYKVYENFFTSSFEISGKETKTSSDCRNFSLSLGHKKTGRTKHSNRISNGSANKDPRPGPKFSIWKSNFLFTLWKNRKFSNTVINLGAFQPFTPFPTRMNRQGWISFDILRKISIRIIPVSEEIGRAKG